MSRGQINNYETVHNSGTDKLKDALLQGKISVSTAAKAAKDLTDEEQDGIAEAVEKGEKVSPADIAAQAKKNMFLHRQSLRKILKISFLQ